MLPQFEEQDLGAPPRAVRHRLPDERASVTHKFDVGGHEGYIIVGLYPDGSVGEIFITMAKEGSTVSGLMDSFACAVSIALQHGVPLKLLCEKFAHTRFEPSGWSKTPEIGFAKSIMDYIFRWLTLRFLTGQQGMLFDNLRPRALASAHQKEGAPSPTTDAIVRRPRPRRRRPGRPDRPGRRAQLPRLRQHHGEKRQLLQVHELREYQRLQLERRSVGRAPSPAKPKPCGADTLVRSKAG